LLLLFINANLSEHTPEEVFPIFSEESKELSRFIDGPFYDYNVKWYIQVGQKVVFTIAIEALIPFIRLTKFLAVRRLNIWRDTGFTNDPYRTK